MFGLLPVCFKVKLDGRNLISSAFEPYNASVTPKYALTALEPNEPMTCVCINDEWETTLDISINTNLSLGYVGGDKTDKQPPWKLELDFICRSPCQDINRFGQPCVGECENE